PRAPGSALASTADPAASQVLPADQRASDGAGWLAGLIAMAKGFVHLRLHTEYSLIDSVVRVPQLIDAVAAAGMPAVALTDQSNLFAMVKFYRAALARGVKPLIGVDLVLREAGER